MVVSYSTLLTPSMKKLPFFSIFIARVIFLLRKQGEHIASTQGYDESYYMTIVSGIRIKHEVLLPPGVEKQR